VSAVTEARHGPARRGAVSKQFSLFRVVLAIMVISLVAMLAGFVFLYLDYNLYRPPPKARRGEISADSFEKIRFMMTMDELESLLGEPDDPPARIQIATNVLIPGGFKFWTSHGQEIRIGFDENKRVVFKVFFPQLPNAYPRITVYRTKEGGEFDSRDHERTKE
jgi:hypothetical protein